MNTIERKVLYDPDILEVDETAGTLKGYANVFGNVDRAGEVVAKGAFVNLDEFYKNGFLAVDHDWSVPVGFISLVQQDEKGLYVEAVFHDTPRGQEVRKVVTDRLLAGKSVAMSIGYRVLADEWVDGIRHLTQVELFEASVVTVPANPKALVVEAKATEPVVTDTLVTHYVVTGIQEAAEAAVEEVGAKAQLVRSYLSYLQRKHFR